MSKIVCIYHSIDLDGFMSAAIVKHWFNSKRLFEARRIVNSNGTLNEETLDFIGYNYGQPIPYLLEYDQVIMVDVSFPFEELKGKSVSRMFQLFQKLNANFIWIDHHISAIKDNIGLEYINDKGEDTSTLFNGLRNTKYAACELTWKYFFPNEPMPEIVRLLGLYDSFRHKGTNEEIKVLEFQYGARAYIKNYEDAYSFLIEELSETESSIVNRLHLEGISVYQYLCTEAKQAYKNGFEIEFIKKELAKVGDTIYSKGYGSNNIKWDTGVIKNIYPYGSDIDTFEYVIEIKGGKEILEYHYNCNIESNKLKFICINKERFNPINFGIDYHKDGYDGAACFHRIAGGKWAFSLYNDNGEVDCSAIAKQFGGGGNKGAAEFVVKNLNEIF